MHVQYDSENEQWDDEERAATLAIGTMMLRRSKAKALVDASYNRFAWNDANDLPEWFVDDEEKHYRPQVRRSLTRRRGQKWTEEGRALA